MRVNDAISGAVLILFGCVVFWLTLSFPPFPGQKYGPSLFPRILAVGLMVCGGLLVIRGLRHRTVGAPLVSIADDLRSGRAVASLFAILGAILFYIVASERLGFLLASGAILLALFLWFRVRLVTALIVAPVATWIIHWFFGSVMRVPLPRGLLTNFI
jgi:putative tricarboxylic transport membrane protein